jgi:hypothetical protein
LSFFAFAHDNESSHFHGILVKGLNRFVEFVDTDPKRWIFKSCGVHYQHLVALGVVAAQASEVACACLLKFLTTKIYD